MPRARDPGLLMKRDTKRRLIFFRRGGLWPTKYSIGGEEGHEKNWPSTVWDVLGVGYYAITYLIPLDNIPIVAANDLTPADELAYLIRYDSVQRGATFPIEFGSNHLQLASHRLSLFNEKDPANLPWKKLGVDIVRVYRAIQKAGKCSKTLASWSCKDNYQRSCR